MLVRVPQDACERFFFAGTVCQYITPHSARRHFLLVLNREATDPRFHDLFSARCPHSRLDLFLLPGKIQRNNIPQLVLAGEPGFLCDLDRVIEVVLVRERNHETMRSISLLKGTAVVLATLGLALPQTRAWADQQYRPAKPQVKVLAPNSILDIKLGSDGRLTGRTINHDGKPAPGATVVVKQGKSIVAKSVTDEKGQFAVSDLKTGVYEVGSGATVGTYRVWTEKSAPPSAKPHCLLVMGENGARGQYGLTETIAEENLGLILLVATTGLALAALLVALHADRVAHSADNKSP